eukprot:4721592-Pleurochrysis_carterae.AAC.1
MGSACCEAKRRRPCVREESLDAQSTWPQPTGVCLPRQGQDVNVSWQRPSFCRSSKRSLISRSSRDARRA